MLPAEMNVPRLSTDPLQGDVKYIDPPSFSSFGPKPQERDVMLISTDQLHTKPDVGGYPAGQVPEKPIRTISDTTGAAPAKVQLTEGVAERLDLVLAGPPPGLALPPKPRLPVDFQEQSIPDNVFTRHDKEKILPRFEGPWPGSEGAASFLMILKPDPAGSGRREGSFATASHGVVLVKCSPALEKDVHMQVRIAPYLPGREVYLSGTHNFCTGRPVYEFSHKIPFKELVEPEKRKLTIWFSARFIKPSEIPPAPPGLPPGFGEQAENIDPSGFNLNSFNVRSTAMKSAFQSYDENQSLRNNSIPIATPSRFAPKKEPNFLRATIPETELAALAARPVSRELVQSRPGNQEVVFTITLEQTFLGDGRISVTSEPALDSDITLHAIIGPSSHSPMKTSPCCHNFSKNSVYILAPTANLESLVDPGDKSLSIDFCAQFPEPGVQRDLAAIGPKLERASTTGQLGPEEPPQLERQRSQPLPKRTLTNSVGYEVAHVLASVFTKRDKQQPVAFQVPSPIVEGESLLFIVTCRAKVNGEGRRMSGFANSDGGEGGIDVTLKARPDVDFKISVVLDAENKSGHGPLALGATHNFGTGKVLCPLKDGVRFLDFVNPADKKLHISFRADALPANFRPS